MSSDGRLYDRLPLEVAQVIRDVQEWRSHVLNSRDECATAALRSLAESADALDAWEREQERGARVPAIPMPEHLTHEIIRRAREARDGKPRPKFTLTVVKPQDDTE